jgi:acetyl-CoA carboxylase biotin carboxyl carrier protein
MNFSELKELIQLLGESNLTELKYKSGDIELTIRTDKFDKGKLVPVEQWVQTTAVPAAPVQAAPAPEAARPAPKPEATAPAAPASNKAQHIIRSPMVGTFYRSQSPEKPPFVKVGDHISAGEFVCIIEAMKLFNEIESDISGTVVQVLVEDAQPVEYDQPLFVVEL